MSTIEQDLALLQRTKSSIKSAIEEKGQIVGSIPFSEYPEKIKAIETGTDLPALTTPGDASDLRYGKQLIDQKGDVVTGSMSTLSLAKPTIEVASSGAITATVTQSESGYLAANTTRGTKQLQTQASKTVTPGTSRKTVVAPSMYTTGAVYVAGDVNLVPENIKKGISIFDVIGTYETSPVIISPESPKTAQITSSSVSGYNTLNFSLDGGPYTVNDMSVFAAKLTISGSLAEASSSYLSLSDRVIYIYVMKDGEGVVAMRYNSLRIVTIKSSEISLSGSTLTIKLRSDTSGGYPYFSRIDSAQATEVIAVYT